MLAWTRGAKSPQFSSVPPSLASPRVAGAIAPQSHPVFRFPGKPLPLPVHCLDRFHDHGPDAIAGNPLQHVQEAGALGQDQRRSRRS